MNCAIKIIDLSKKYSIVHNNHAFQYKTFRELLSLKPLLSYARLNITKKINKIKPIGKENSGHSKTST